MRAITSPFKLISETGMSLGISDVKVGIMPEPAKHDCAKANRMAIHWPLQN